MINLNESIDTTPEVPRIPQIDYNKAVILFDQHSWIFYEDTITLRAGAVLVAPTHLSSREYRIQPLLARLVMGPGDIVGILEDGTPFLISGAHLDAVLNKKINIVEDTRA